MASAGENRHLERFITLLNQHIHELEAMAQLAIVSLQDPCQIINWKGVEAFMQQKALEINCILAAVRVADIEASNRQQNQ